MKSIFFVLLFGALSTTATAQVKFETKSTDAIHELAIQEKKLVFIDLYAPWCPPCRTMDKQVFARKDVGVFMNAHFVNAKYNVDEYTGAALMDKYKAEGVPTYLIFNANGELLGKITGASDAQQFLSNVRRVIEESGLKR